MSSKMLDKIKNHPFISRAERNTTKADKEPITTGKIICRSLLVIFTVLICLIITLFLSLKILVGGECEPLRNKLVLSAMQASATKWLPGLFLSDETVEKIVSDSYIVNTDVLSLEEYSNISSENGDNNIWVNAKDGIILETVTGSTFTGYVMLVKDPSRIFVGTSSDFKQGLIGMTIFDIAKKENAIAAINAGEFADPGGQGTGNNPMGITYSRGKCVWNDSLKRTFIGFDNNNKLIVTEPMDKKTADELGIRDGVSFQNGNTLITNEDGNITLHYADNNTGTAQRTAIGQTFDGTVILLVTDGRSASSLGATKNDVIDVMVKYGAITAGMLDGGSSSLMYYENYFDKYDYDTELLDQYQKKGLVNRYKAFTTPRRMPTFICVAYESTEQAQGEQ